MSELRAGGLAIIIGLRNYAHYNGKCVELIELVKPGQIYKSPTNKKTLRHQDDFAWVVMGDVINPNGDKGWGTLKPKNLLPIDGKDFSHEDERQKELVNG